MIFCHSWNFGIESHAENFVRLQMCWPDGRNQGKSMDLIQEVDKQFCGNYPEAIKNDVINKA